MSIGNVGQLAVDVILASLAGKPQLVTSLYHPAIIPLVASDPLDLKSDRLMTACQLYKTEKEAVLQLRSALVQGQREQFCDDLVEWIKAQKFAKVILLTSMSADERLDSQIQGQQFRFVSTFDSLRSELQQLEFSELEARKAESDLFLPGSGYSKSLYEKCVKENIPIGI